MTLISTSSSSTEVSSLPCEPLPSVPLLLLLLRLEPRPLSHLVPRLLRLLVSRLLRLLVVQLRTEAGQDGLFPSVLLHALKVDSAELFGLKGRRVFCVKRR